MKSFLLKTCILFTLTAVLSGCGSASKRSERSEVISEEFRDDLKTALQYADPDRRLDAIAAVPAQSEAERFLKHQFMARVALTHKPSAFAAAAEPLIAAVNRKDYHETSDEAQALARLGGVATGNTASVTRRVAAAVDTACSRRSIINRDIGGTEREKGDSYIAEACFYLLTNDPDSSANSELRAVAWYQHAALEEVLPVYITQPPADGKPYVIQVLQGRLCHALGVFCDAVNINGFSSSR